MSQIVMLRTHDGEEAPYPLPKKQRFVQTKGPGVSWAHWTWNPVTGCLRGCEYCYAREFAGRMRHVYPAGFKPLFHHERLAAPAETPTPKGSDPALRRVFVCSMADLYGGWVPGEWIEQVHEACADNPQWQYIHLTKNPARYVENTPPHGAWVGASVDEQKMVRIAEQAMERVEGAAVKWLSLEPMLEELHFTDLSMFDWVVIGAQTKTIQPGGKVVPQRAPDPAWVKRIMDQAREAGCKIHIKPNLPRQPGVDYPDEYPASLAPA